MYKSICLFDILTDIFYSEFEVLFANMQVYLSRACHVPKFGFHGRPQSSAFTNVTWFRRREPMLDWMVMMVVVSLAYQSLNSEFDKNIFQ